MTLSHTHLNWYLMQIVPVTYVWTHSYASIILFIYHIVLNYSLYVGFYIYHHKGRIYRAIQCFRKKKSMFIRCNSYKGASYLHYDNLNKIFYGFLTLYVKIAFCIFSSIAVNENDSWRNVLNITVQEKIIVVISTTSYLCKLIIILRDTKIFSWDVMMIFK